MVAVPSVGRLCRLLFSLGRIWVQPEASPDGEVATGTEYQQHPEWPLPSLSPTEVAVGVNRQHSARGPSDPRSAEALGVCSQAAR